MNEDRTHTCLFAVLPSLAGRGDRPGRIPDPTFGGAGGVLVPFDPNGLSYLSNTKVVVRSDGAIVIVGAARSPPRANVTLLWRGCLPMGPWTRASVWVVRRWCHSTWGGLRSATKRTAWRCNLTARSWLPARPRSMGRLGLRGGAPRSRRLTRWHIRSRRENDRVVRSRGPTVRRRIRPRNSTRRKDHPRGTAEEAGDPYCRWLRHVSIPMEIWTSASVRREKWHCL